MPVDIRSICCNARAVTDERLRELFEADQADRREGIADIAGMMRRDGDRRSAVRRVLAGITAPAAVDLYHAAMILQHGESIEDIAQAHDLASRAAEADYTPARWLSAATVDRLLMYQGKPQRYGTQSVSDGTRWRLWDVEEATTDAERAALDVPPLHQLEAEVDEHTEGLPHSPDDRVAPWLLEARKRWRAAGEASTPRA